MLTTCINMGHMLRCTHASLCKPVHAFVLQSTLSMAHWVQFRALHVNTVNIRACVSILVELAVMNLSGKRKKCTRDKNVDCTPLINLPSFSTYS